MPSVHPNSLECTQNIRARTPIQRSGAGGIAQTISYPRAHPDPSCQPSPRHWVSETNPGSGSQIAKRTQRPRAQVPTAPPLSIQAIFTRDTNNPRAPYIASETNPSRGPKPPKRTRAFTASHETNPGDRLTMRMHDTGVPVSDAPRLPIRWPDDRMRTVPGHDPSSRIRCPRKKPGPRARLSQSGRQNVWERKRGSPSARGSRHCTGRDARLTMAVPTSMTAQNHDHAATHNK